MKRNLTTGVCCALVLLGLLFGLVHGEERCKPQMFPMYCLSVSGIPTDTDVITEGQGGHTMTFSRLCDDKCECPDTPKVVATVQEVETCCLMPDVINGKCTHAIDVTDTPHLTPFTIQALVPNDNIDSGKRLCTISFIVGKVEKPFCTTQIVIKEDDTASVNLYTIERDEYTNEPDDQTYTGSYAVRFLQFFVFEGGTVAYGIKLETQPIHNVSISVNVTLKPQYEVAISANVTALRPPLEPPTVVANPSSLTFTPSNWNDHQKVYLTSRDDDIDHNEERFEVRHVFASVDSKYNALEENDDRKVLIVVDAADDDEVGIELEKTETVTIEVGCSITDCPDQSITITRLKSKPVHDVVIYADTNTPNVNADPTFFTVLKDQWDNIGKQVNFSASAAVPSLVDITLRTVSNDTNYNVTKMLEIFNSITPAEALNIKGLPENPSVSEGQDYNYNFSLTKKTSESVTVNVTVSGHGCTLTQRSFPIQANHDAVGPITIQTLPNFIDEGADSECKIEHQINNDESTKKEFTLTAINDDTASTYLYTVAPSEYEADEVNYVKSYAVRFLPFYMFEGGTVAYAIKLETEPTDVVQIEVTVNLVSGEEILAPPTLVASASSLEFKPSNWHIYQKIMLTSGQDDVHHKTERFEVRHVFNSVDLKYNALEENKDRNLLVVVDAADDDEVGIVLEKTETVTLKVECSITDCPGQSVTITRLKSKPVHDVVIYVDTNPSNVNANVDHFTVLKDQWNNIGKEVTFYASAIGSGPVDITLRTVSNDTNYNVTKMLEIFTSITPADEDIAEPETRITAHPPKEIHSLHKSIDFTVKSNDKNVDKFLLKRGWLGEKEEDVDGCSSSTCSFTINSLYDREGVFSITVRAKDSSGKREDRVGATYEWSMGRCEKEDYIDSLASNGVYNCTECPEGADCSNEDDEWFHIIAQEGYWTKPNGSKADIFHPCPFHKTSEACMGGDNENASSIIRSRCVKGFEGPVCAVCAKGYYLSSLLCVKCPDEPASQVSLVFGGYICVFLAILFSQMRIKTTKFYWSAIKDEATQNKRKNKLDRKTVKKIRVFVQFAMTTLKTFITYLQIMSVSHTVFSISWPPAFKEFLKSLSVMVQLDLFSMSGLSCVQPYSFYDNHKAIVLGPIVVGTLVFIIYKIGFWRHKIHYGRRFTKGMQTSYGNHVIQFAMWITIIVYPTISTRAIAYFNCSKDIDGHQYLMDDFREKCYTGEWNDNFFFGFLGVSLYSLGIPAFFGWSLWSRRHRLDETDVAHRYGFLYEMYRRETYWWDVYEMMQKLFLTGVIVLIFPKSDLQVAIAVLADLCFLINLLVQRPHVAGPTRNLATMANVAVTMSMYCGLLLNSVEGVSANEGLVVVIDSLLILMNGAVAVYAGYHVAPCRVCLMKSKAEHAEKTEKAKKKFMLDGKSDAQKTSFIVKSLSSTRLTAVIPARDVSTGGPPSERIRRVGKMRPTDQTARTQSSGHHSHPRKADLLPHRRSPSRPTDQTAGTQSYSNSAECQDNGRRAAQVKQPSKHQRPPKKACLPAKTPENVADLPPPPPPSHQTGETSSAKASHGTLFSPVQNAMSTLKNYILQCGHDADDNYDLIDKRDVTAAVGVLTNKSSNPEVAVRLAQHGVVKTMILLLMLEDCPPWATHALLCLNNLSALLLRSATAKLKYLNPQIMAALFSAVGKNVQAVLLQTAERRIHSVGKAAIQLMGTIVQASEDDRELSKRFVRHGGLHMLLLLSHHEEMKEAAKMARTMLGRFEEKALRSLPSIYEEHPDISALFFENLEKELEIRKREFWSAL